MKPSTRRWLLQIMQIAVVALVFLFIARSVVALWPDIVALKWNLSPALLACALLAGIASQGLLVLGWRLAIGLVGAEIPWDGALVSQTFGQLAKYVPGKVLTVVGKGYLASRAGVPESRAVVAMFVEAGVLLATALGLGSVYIIVLAPTQRALLPITILAVLVCCGLLHPALLPRAINALLVRLGRHAPPFSYRLSAVVPLVACYLVFWCVTGAGLWLLGLGLGLRLSVITLTAAYAVSWAAGFLSMIFPGGLGVREYALARLLGPAVPAGAAMSVALASRAWILAAELLVACAVWSCQMTAILRVSPVGANSDGTDGR
jgi:uncharacterized membrane protein YbhN (UPF0104 family)